MTTDPIEMSNNWQHKRPNAALAHTCFVCLGYRTQYGTSPLRQTYPLIEKSTWRDAPTLIRTETSRNENFAVAWI